MAKCMVRINGNISIGNDKYIRVIKNSRRLLPMFVPNSKPIEQVVTDLFNNILKVGTELLNHF